MTLLKAYPSLLSAADKLCEVAGVDATEPSLSEWLDAVRDGALAARVASALVRADGNRTRAAQLLGVSSSYVGRVAEQYPELMKAYPARAGNPHDAGARDGASKDSATPSKAGRRKKKQGT